MPRRLAYYYATVATVPLLFVLALAAERRLGLREQSDSSFADAAFGILLLTSFAIGGLAAMSALAASPTRAEKHAADLALGIAGLAL